MTISWILLSVKKSALIKLYKKLVVSNSMSEETRRHLKPAGTRPGIMYGSCKAHKKCVDGCPPFTPILSGLQTPTYKPAKYSAPILESLTNNKYTVKDSFNFATDTVEQDISNFMGSLDIDSIFTNILLEETIVFKKVNLKTFYLYQPENRVLYLIMYYTNKLTE